VSGGVRGLQTAGYWRVKCPQCGAAPFNSCVRLDGSGVELRQRHESRAVLGRMYLRQGER
jgi:hypothetical protein